MTIKKIILYLPALLMFFSSCEKNEDNTVSYSVTDCQSGFDITYLDENDQKVSAFIQTSSEEDEWKYSFKAEEGKILYMSVRYYDPLSSVRARISLDAKVFKEAYSKNDTTTWLVVSGTIPY